MLKLHTAVSFALLAASVAFAAHALTSGNAGLFTGEDGKRISAARVFGLPANQAANLEETMTDHPTISKAGYRIERLSDETIAWQDKSKAPSLYLRA